MKWILSLVLFVSLASFGQTDDSTKYTWYKTQYGQRMPRGWWDSVAHMPYGDTTVYAKPSRPGAIMMHTDKNFYRWDGLGWRTLGGSGSTPALQEVTDQGNYTNGALRIVSLADPGTEYASLTSSGSQGRLFLENGIGGSTEYTKDSIIRAGNALRFPTGPGTLMLTKDSGLYVTPTRLKDTAQVLRTLIGSGGGSPGGSTTQIQYNSSGAFAGDAGLTYDAATNKVTTDSLIVVKSRQDTTHIRITNNAQSLSNIYNGTSITAGVGPSSSAYRFSTRTSEKMNVGEINMGISGAKLTVQGVADLPNIPNYNSAVHKYIILEWGVNDINSATDSTTFIGVYDDYIDTLLLHRGFPASSIMMLQPSYINPVTFPTSTLAKQLSFRQGIAALAALKGCLTFDVASAQMARNPDNLLVDGLHPNNDGSDIYVAGIVSVTGSQVYKNAQTLAANGKVEFQSLKLSLKDTASAKVTILGQDSAGNVVRVPHDQVIQNSSVLPAPQGASISLVGKGFFGNVVSPTSVEVVQANGIIKGTSLRAVGAPAVGQTGAGLEIAYNAGVGLIYGYDRDASAAKPLSLNFLGQPVLVNASAANGASEEMLQVNGGINGHWGRFTSSVNGTGLSGSAVEIALSGTTGAVYAYDRTGSSGLNLNLGFGLSPFVIVGANTVTGTAPFQVNSRTFISDELNIGSSTDNGAFALQLTGRLYGSAGLQLNTTSTSSNIIDRLAYINGSVGINKDSVPTVITPDDSFILILDSSDNEVKKVSPNDVARQVINAGTSSFTITIGALTVLPSLAGAGNRTVTLPAASSHTGKFIFLWNKNADANLWSFGSTYTDPNGSTASTISNGTYSAYQSTGSEWLRIQNN